MLFILILELIFLATPFIPTIALDLMLLILILEFIFIATLFIPKLGLELMLVTRILAFIFLPTPLMDFYTALATTLLELKIVVDSFLDASFVFIFTIDDIFSKIFGLIVTGKFRITFA